MLSRSEVEVFSARIAPELLEYSKGMPWVESPFFDRILEKANLSPFLTELAKRYRQNGYVIIDPEIPEFDLIAEQIRLSLFPDLKENLRIADAWSDNEWVRKVATNEKIMFILEFLYQRRAIPFQTLNFPMGTEQDTHSDTIHFHSFPERFMAGVWIAFEDMDADNGPLHYYPGSHQWPCYDYSHMGMIGSGREEIYGQEYAFYKKFIKELVAASGTEKKEFYAKKGQALIWSANLLHGGSPIKDLSRTRHSQVTHYYFENCLYYTPMLSDLGLQRVHRRNIFNIATGEYEKPFYLNHPVQIQF